MQQTPRNDDGPPAYAVEQQSFSPPLTSPASASGQHRDAYTNIAAGLIGLIADSFQTIDDISDLQAGAAQEVVTRLGHAKSAVQSLKPTVQLFYKYLRHVEQRRLALPARSSLIDIDVVITLAAEAILAMSDLGVLMQTMADAPPPTSDEGSLVVDGDEDLRQAHVENICALNTELMLSLGDRIRVVEKLMSKTLTVLRVGDEPEAERNKIQIQEQVLGMLQSSLTLADRVQQVQNTFGVSGLNDQDSSFAFTGITLANVDVLSLIPIPVSSSELANGRFYEPAYAEHVRADLDALVEANVKEKNRPLAKILGLKEPGKVAAEDDKAARAAHRLSRWQYRGMKTRQEQKRH